MKIFAAKIFHVVIILSHISMISFVKRDEISQ